MRALIWVVFLASGALLAAALRWGGGSDLVPSTGGRPSVAQAQPSPSGRALRSVRPALGQRALQPAPASPRQALRATAAAAPAAPQAPPLADSRSAELVDLERDAMERALSEGLVDREALEAAAAALEPAPGEGADDFARRAAAWREQLASSELLLQHQLGELFSGTVYPHGFPVEQIVVAQERQLVGQLPPQERAARLRGILGVWQPARAVPRLESPESGLVWKGGSPPL